MGEKQILYNLFINSSLRNHPPGGGVLVQAHVIGSGVQGDLTEA